MLGLGLALVPVVWADPASDACAALVDSRSALYFMINAKDKAAHDAFNEKCKWQALRGQYLRARRHGSLRQAVRALALNCLMTQQFNFISQMQFATFEISHHSVISWLIDQTD